MGAMTSTSSFRLLRQFADPARAGLLRGSGRIDERCLPLFPGDGLGDQLARALARRSALPLKEVLESYEFFAAVRKEVRRADLVDACSGHGLVGALFALYERKVERVTFIEKHPPASREEVLAAACEVGPWVADKLHLLDGALRKRGPEVAPGSAVVAVHACGLRSDEAIDLALSTGGPVALMPCCRPHGRSPAPDVLTRELGGDLAFDVDRTYRMEQAGYVVRWTQIPEGITPQNRILVGRPRAGAS